MLVALDMQPPSIVYEELYCLCILNKEKDLTGFQHQPPVSAPGKVTQS